MDMEKKKLSYQEVAETMSGLVVEVNVILEKVFMKTVLCIIMEWHLNWSQIV